MAEDIEAYIKDPKNREEINRVWKEVEALHLTGPKAIEYAELLKSGWKRIDSSNIDDERSAAYNYAIK